MVLGVIITVPVGCRRKWANVRLATMHAEFSQLLNRFISSEVDALETTGGQPF